MKKKAEQIRADKAKALEYLHEYLKPGDKVYTILRHVSQSGMNRRISVIIPTLSKEGKPGFYDITHLVATACEYRTDPRNEGLKVGGCGMDLGFSVVYHLSHVLWPDGFACTGDGCPSNDHSNGENNSHHIDGGYALKQSWL